LLEVQECYEGSCSCPYLPWEPWEECSKSCGGGSQTRTREVLGNAHETLSCTVCRNKTMRHASVSPRLRSPFVGHMECMLADMWRWYAHTHAGIPSTSLWRHHLPRIHNERRLQFMVLSN
jgi:hypothetical protein